MMVSALSNSKNIPLAEHLWPRPAHPANMRVSVLVLLGVALLTLSAKIQVPLWPVPMTLQTLVVLSLGLTYGRSLAVATLSAYLLFGALGLPVFAGTPERGIGVLYILGPTGGFLFGFLLAVLATALLADRGFDRTFLRAALAMVVGNVIILGTGFLWLYGYTNLTLGTAWTQGVEPFLWGNLLQSLLAIVFLPALWKRINARV